MERCPNCNARQQGATECHRCAMDLSTLLAIEARAEHWEREALTRLAEGDSAAAREAAARALRLQQRELARVLLGFAAWLEREGDVPQAPT